KGEPCIARQQHLAAVEAVRSMAGRQKKKKPGQELRQADQPQVEWALGDFINLPAHGYRLHLQRDDNQKARQLVEHKVWMSKRNPAGKTWVLGSEHADLLSSR